MDGRQIEQVLDERFDAAMNTLGQEMVDDLKQKLSTPYPPASEPGNSPHRRSGELAESVFYEIERFVDASPEVFVSFTAEHGRYVNSGTSRMAARPFMAIFRAKWKALFRARMMEIISGQ